MGEPTSWRTWALLASAKAAQSLHSWISTLAFHADRSIQGSSPAIRSIYFASSRRMLAAGGEIAKIQAARWAALVGFPSQGWASRAGWLLDPKNLAPPRMPPSLVNILLADQRLPWASSDPSDIAGVQALLRAKARQIAGLHLAPMAAQLILDRIPPRAASHAHFFRDLLDAMDPGWHRRSAQETSGDPTKDDSQMRVAAQILLRSPEASAQAHRARTEHEACLEAAEIQKSAGSPAGPAPGSKRPRL